MACKPHRSSAPLRATVFVVATIIAVAAVKWGIAPTWLRHRLQSTVARHWDGAIAVAVVEFNFLTPTYLRGVTLRDDRGAVVAKAARVSMKASRFVDFRPTTVEIEIEGIALPPLYRSIDARRGLAARGRLTLGTGQAVHLDGWRVHLGQTTVADGVTAKVAIVDGAMALDDLTGRILGGRLTGVFIYSHGASTRASGRLEMAGVDLRGITLVQKLCRFLDIDDLSPLATAAVDTTFEIADGVVTITRGRTTSGLPTIDIEPGGRIDLATGEINASLVPATGTKLGQMPLLNPVGTLVKNLTRIYVHGRWHDPEETLFSRN